MDRRRAVNTVVLIADDITARFEPCSESLTTLTRHLDHEGRLVRTDLFVVENDVLLALLAISPDCVPLDAVRGLADDRTTSKFRLLDLSALSDEHLRRFFESKLRNIRWESKAVTDVGAALASLREVLFDEVHDRGRSADQVYVELAAELHCEGLGITTGQARSISAEEVWIATDQHPSVGEELTLGFATAEPNNTLSLRARVVHTGPSPDPELGSEVGFGAQFVLSADERRLLESFVVAQTRCIPWPGPSGRRFERFPIRLRVDYEHAGESRRERVGDLSRGGVFIVSEEPPPVGTGLALNMTPAGGGRPLAMEARVAHRVGSTAMRAGGFGAEFVGDATAIEDHLRVLLGQIPVPATRRVLIVDDDRFFREVISSAFVMSGYEVLTAGDGETAFRMVLDELLNLDVLVVDLFMPGQTGIELIEKIRRAGGEHELLVVILTGADIPDEDRHGLLEFGANEVFPKSIDPMDLVARINDRVAERWEQSASETIDEQLDES